MSTADARAVPADGAPGEDRAGLFAALTAFLIWGLLPLYLRPLAQVPALQITAHRVVESCLLVFLYLAAKGQLGAVRAALADPRTRLRLVGSTLMISVNWLVYVWAVGNGHVVDASLGYFINPLVSVLMGVALLSERLGRVQWLAVAIAACGVAYLTWATGRVPWIALVLALTFGTYGLIRKIVAVESVPGLAVETLLLFPLALGWLLWCEWQGTGAFGQQGRAVDALLVGSGIVTATPLALFAFGARRIRLSTVGLLQYLGPTLQFLTGVLVFREPFPHTRLIGFAIIWSALAVYVGDSLWRRRGARY